MPYLAFLFICLAWGASFILMDRAAFAFGPVAIGMGRLLGGAAIVVVYCFVKRKWTRLRASDWFHITVVAVLANALPFVVQPYVMIQAGEHAYFGLMVTLVPIATILISIPMLGVHPTPRQLIGVLGGLVCAGLIVYDGDLRGISRFNLALALSVPVTYAIGNTYIKWKLDHLPSAPLTLLVLTIGGLLLAPLQMSPVALATLNMPGPGAPHDWPIAILSLAFLSVVGTGVAILLFIHLVKTQGPLFAGMVTYVVPLLALMWGQYDKEKLTPLQVAAVAGILAMVAMVQWRAAAPQQVATAKSAPDCAATVIAPPDQAMD